MTKKTTCEDKYNEKQQMMFLAFELGASKWVLDFSLGLGKSQENALWTQGI